MAEKSINLNSFIFNERVTKEDVLSRVSQEEIYQFYSGEPVECNTRLHSPLRQDDVPSFAYYYHKHKPDTLMFYDFATKDNGDCIVFVMTMFRLNYQEVLFKIAYDFKLSDVVVTAERRRIISSKKVQQKAPVEIGIKRRNWSKVDANFWKPFGIKKETLELYNVSPISHMFFNDKPVKADTCAYAYMEYKDEKVSYKIYQPYSKRYKWINNANYTVHQGYRQLPNLGELLIITKSLKDVMSLRDVMGIPSVGLQSESVMMKPAVMEEYKFRFDKVICLFDNDKAGKKLSVDFTFEYDIPHVFVPELEGVTDFSDLVKKLGIEEARKQFKKIISEI
jgi:hypothetical protein